MKFGTSDISLQLSELGYGCYQHSITAVPHEIKTKFSKEWLAI
jgi:hypothetical protein